MRERKPWEHFIQLWIEKSFSFRAKAWLNICKILLRFCFKAVWNHLWLARLQISHKFLSSLWKQKYNPNFTEKQQNVKFRAGFQKYCTSFGAEEGQSMSWIILSISHEKVKFMQSKYQIGSLLNYQGSVELLMDRELSLSHHMNMKYQNACLECCSSLKCILICLLDYQLLCY